MQEIKEELPYTRPQYRFLSKLRSRGNTACVTKVKMYESVELPFENV